MPDYLDGGTPSTADVRAIADHLSGVAALSTAHFAAADLDADGQVTAADLLLMARLAAGDLPLPLPRPRLIVASLEVARPAEQISIEGEELGIAPADVRALLDTGSDQVDLSVQSLTDTRIDLTIPGMLGVTALETPGVITVFRHGVPSNPLSLAILAGPVLRGIERQGGDLRLEGAGFGTTATAVRVRFADTETQPSSVQDDLVWIVAPVAITEPVAVRVIVDGAASNAFAYVPMADGSGKVSLPANSPLGPTDLHITGASGEPVVVAANGSFGFAAEVGEVSSFEANDDQDTMILTALRVRPGVLHVDARSTAIWLVYFGVAANLGAFAQRAALVDALTSDPAVVALADSIAAAHPSTPSIKEQVEQRPAVRAALQAALVAGSALKAELVGEETGP
jgi:hypothetical protein